MSASERAFIEKIENEMKLDPVRFFGRQGTVGFGGAEQNALGKDTEKLDPKSPATKAIHEAAHKGYTRALKLLVSRGVPVDTPLSNGVKPLHSACTIGQVKSCETLLNLGADLHGEGESGGWTAIHYAAGWGRTDVVKFLVEKGAKVNSQIERIEQDRVLRVPTGTPLHVASRDANPGYPETVKMLLSLGADINAATSAGQTPLMTASRNGNAKAVEVLLEAGANMELQYKIDPQKGQTALHDVAWFGDEKVAQLLLEKGANPNARKAEGTEGYTPLHHTAIRDCFAVAKLLVKHGADIQATDFAGNTALHLALQKGSVAGDAYLVWLLEQGLNPMQPNAKGEMPISLATGSRVELIAKKSFYPQWAKKRAISLVRRGSFIPAGAFAEPSEAVTPRIRISSDPSYEGEPNLDAFLQHTIGPNYARRISGSVLGGGVRFPTLNIVRMNSEGKFTTAEYIVASGFVPDPPKQEPDFKSIRLKWGDIVEIDINAYLPSLKIEQESEALVKTQLWLSEPFPDTERGNQLVRMQLYVTMMWAGVAQQKVQVTYFNAKTHEQIKSAVDGKEFTWTLEEVAGQRLLRVALAPAPLAKEMVCSYSLDGDSLSLMRLRRLGAEKDKDEPPFQTGTLIFHAVNGISPRVKQAAAWLANKQAVSLVRGGSDFRAGGFIAASENASPPNLDTFLQHTIGPNYAKRNSIYIASGGVIAESTIRIWRKNKEEQLSAVEVKIPGLIDEAAAKKEPAWKSTPLQWGDIVEVDNYTFVPTLTHEQESEALVKAGRWLSEPFPDPDHDNRLIRVQLDFSVTLSTGGKSGVTTITKVQSAYFNAKTNEPIKTVVDGLWLPCNFEDDFGQRWIRIVTGAQPSLRDIMLSYSLDGDTLSFMRVRRQGDVRVSTEPPFPLGTHRFHAVKPVPAGQVQAAAWFEALMSADLEKVAALVDVPFSLDRKSVLKTKDELLAVHKQMVEKKGKRPAPKYTIALTNDAPKLDAAVFPKYEAYRVLVEIGDEKEGIDIYVSTGDNPKVIGFSD